MSFYIKYPISKASEPPQDGACWIYRNRYWIVVDDCLLFHRGLSPQCNSNESISARLSNGKEVRFLSLVFAPAIETGDGLNIDVTGERLEINK